MGHLAQVSAFKEASKKPQNASKEATKCFKRGLGITYQFNENFVNSPSMDVIAEFFKGGRRAKLCQLSKKNL